jgi:hypothetical protein
MVAEMRRMSEDREDGRHSIRFNGSMVSPNCPEYHGALRSI